MLRTWRALIAEALVRSGFVGPGQTANEKAFQVGLNQLNFTLDQLDGEGLLLPAMIVLTFNTIANQPKYLLGTSDASVAGATAIRPTTILDVTVNIASGTATFLPLKEISFQEYQILAIPSTQSQPNRYAVNPKYPQSEIYLYPNPVQVYPMALTCKVKWSDTTGDPDLNVSTIADLSQGYYNGLTDIVALRVAEYARLQTTTLENRSRDARFMMMVYVSKQIKPKIPSGQGVFPWVTGQSGINV